MQEGIIFKYSVIISINIKSALSDWAIYFKSK